MIVWPEIPRIIAEFKFGEGCAKAPDLRCHEHVKGIQYTFKKQILVITIDIEIMGHPFIEDNPNVLVLNTKDVVDQRMVDIEKDKFASFMNDRIDNRHKSVFEPLCHDKLLLSHFPLELIFSRDEQQTNELNKSYALFSQL